MFGLDTEFMRTNTFFPIPALIQVSTTEAIYFLDPLTITDFSPFREILDDPRIIKIMHAIGEDVELLRVAMGATLIQVFDTQVAAAICNVGFSLGYAALVKKLLDEDVEKGETRSNWLNRPLTEAQEKYAAIDVVYLHELYSLLSKELDKRDLVAAVYEDTSRLISQSHVDNTDTYYLKLRGGWRLSTEKQNVLKHLCQWREERARTRNIPRSRVVADNDLIEIATYLPQSEEMLLGINTIKPWALKKDAKPIIDSVMQALADTQLTEFVRIQPPLDSNQQLIYKNLRKRVADIAESRQIPQEILVNKRMLEKTVLDTFTQNTVVLSEEMQGWRGDVVAEVITQELSTELAKQTAVE